MKYVFTVKERSGVFFAQFGDEGFEGVGPSPTLAIHDLVVQLVNDEGGLTLDQAAAFHPGTQGLSKREICLQYLRDNPRLLHEEADFPAIAASLRVGKSTLYAARKELQRASSIPGTE